MKLKWVRFRNKRFPEKDLFLLFISVLPYKILSQRHNLGQTYLAPVFCAVDPIWTPQVSQSLAHSAKDLDSAEVKHIHRSQKLSSQQFSSTRNTLKKGSAQLKFKDNAKQNKINIKRNKYKTVLSGVTNTQTAFLAQNKAPSLAFTIWFVWQNAF